LARVDEDINEEEDEDIEKFLSDKDISDKEEDENNFEENLS
jgi:hypothetical protein